MSPCPPEYLKLKKCFADRCVITMRLDLSDSDSFEQLGISSQNILVCSGAR